MSAAWIVLLGEEARSDNAGRIAYPSHVDLGRRRLGRLLKRRQLIVLERRVDGELRLLLRMRRSACPEREGNGQPGREKFHRHDVLLLLWVSLSDGLAADRK
jgi:hypothetical protein